MIIHYKQIIPERCEDAPFVGALISSIGCSINCKGCFNRHLLELPTLMADSTSIIADVKYNTFHQGIILGGLEWTEQPIEAFALLKEARKQGLLTMLYSGRNFAWLQVNIPEILECCNYIKYGEYVEKDSPKEVRGVRLASSNQYII